MAKWKQIIFIILYIGTYNILAYYYVSFSSFVDGFARVKLTKIEIEN